MTIVPSQPKSPQKTCDTASHPWALCHTSTASVQHTVRLTVRPFSGTWDPLAQLAERPKDITLRRPDRVGSKQDHLEPKLYAKIQPHGVMLLRSFYIVCWFALFVESIFDDYFGVGFGNNKCRLFFAFCTMMCCPSWFAVLRSAWRGPSCIPLVGLGSSSHFQFV